MRRKPRQPAKATRRDTPPPPVPTFQSASETITETPAQPDDDAADEAVRRMVEAAYT